MHVTIEITGTEEPSELHALAALIHTLGGRVPCMTEHRPNAETIAAMLEPPVRIGTLDDLRADLAAPIAPPPPPPIMAPNAPAPVAAPPPVGSSAADASARDVNGLPWDERIHSSNREPNADGSWRKRRGVSDELVRSVTAELLGRAAPLAPTVAPPPPPPAVTVSPEPVVTAAPSVAPPPPPPAAPTSMTFPQLAASIGQRRGGVGYTYDELNHLATMIGLTTFRDLMQRHDLIDTFVGMLEA